MYIKVRKSVKITEYSSVKKKYITILHFIKQYDILLSLI